MSSPEEFENVIALMKKALEFYADPKTYDGTVPLIDIDEQGSQARFVLKQAEDLIEQNRKMQEDYDQIIAAGEMLQANHDKADPQKLMEVFKVFENEKGISEFLYIDEERKHVNEMKENAKNFNNDSNNI